MARVPIGTEPWGGALNADLNGIEAKADQALAEIAGRLSESSLSEKFSKISDNHSLLAYAENRSGQATAAATGANWSIIEGTIISVPPSERDVWLFWRYIWGINVGGQGTFTAAPWELTDFSTTFQTNIAGGSTGARLWSNSIPRDAMDPHHGFCSIGPSDEYRQFALLCHTIQEGSSLATYVRNLDPILAGHTFLAAVMM